MILLFLNVFPFKKTKKISCDCPTANYFVFLSPNFENSMGVIIRQSIKGTIVNYIGVGVGIITTFFILTKYLTEEQVGLTRVLVDAAILFSSLAQLGTGSSIVRYFPYFKDEEQKHHGLFFWSLIIPFVGFLLFLLVFFLFKGMIVDAFQEKSPLFIHYFYFVIPIAFFMLYTAVFEVNATILNRVAVPKFIREVVIRCCLLIGYILFGFKIISLDGLVMVFCVTYGLAALLNFFYLLSTQKISFKPDYQHITKDLFHNFLLYTLFMLATALVTAVLPTLSSFFITAEMGLAFAGIYAIANYIATMIEIPYRSLSAMVQPRISLAIKENDIPKATVICQKVALHQFLAGTVIFLIVWMNIDLLFQILPNGEAYAAGKWVVFILALSRLVNSSFGIGCTALGYTKYYYYSLFFTLLLMGLSIGLNTVMIPVFGMTGGALATLFSYAIYYALLLWFIQKMVGTTPFSWGLLKTAVLVLFLYFVHLLCSFTFGRLFSHDILWQSLLEALLRTGVVCILGLYLVYKFVISLELNQIIDNMKSRIHGRR